ncbi:MAG: flippase-like domain-containing protein [SAR202 cluster bacterium]|nr:flippase-like domain-containing protein [SAR202 cluster bacterium]
MLNRKRLTIVYAVVAIGLGIAMLVFVFREVSPREVARLLRVANPWLIALGLLLMPVNGLLHAYRWRLLLFARVGLRRLFFVEQTGIAINALSFLRVLDEFVRLGILSVRDRVPAGQVLASEAMQRTLEFAAATVIFAFGVTFFEPLSRFRLPAAVALGLAALALTALFTVGPALSRVGLLRRAGFVQVFAESARIMRRQWRGAIAAFALSLGASVVAGMAGWLTARAVGVEIDSLEAIVITEAVRMFVGFVPGLPFAFGTFELVAIGLLGLWGFGADCAVTFAFALRGVLFVPTLALGFGFMMSEGLLSLNAFRALGPKGRTSDAGE